MDEKNENRRTGETDENRDRRADEEAAHEEGAPRGSGAEFTEEFRPEPVKQRESRGQEGPGEGPQVAPGEG
jgi:hypothetical protein